MMEEFVDVVGMYGGAVGLGECWGVLRQVGGRMSVDVFVEVGFGVVGKCNGVGKLLRKKL